MAVSTHIHRRNGWMDLYSLMSAIERLYGMDSECSHLEEDFELVFCIDWQSPGNPQYKNLTAATIKGCGGRLGTCGFEIA